VCFYSFCFYSQTKTALFILFEINRVQLVHKGLTGFGAVILEEVRRKPRAVRRFSAPFAQNFKVLVASREAAHQHDCCANRVETMVDAGFILRSISAGLPLCEIRTEDSQALQCRFIGRMFPCSYS
jgi:hypothetical protein